MTRPGRAVRPAELVERTDGRVMGSEATIVVVGSERGAAPAALRRLSALERLWSRFDPASEVSALNRSDGRPQAVAPETRRLVETAVAGWRRTGGHFDPTVLGAVVRAGYDCPFEALGDGPAGSPADAVRTGLHSQGGTRAPTDPGRAGCDEKDVRRLGTGCGGIVVGERTVTLPVGVGFDPGGLGKGLAADLVVAELQAVGAAGACVAVGGDVVVAGRPPDAAVWEVDAADPFGRAPRARLGVAAGAVATSGRTKRVWSVDGQSRHHLVDPATGLNPDVGLASVTVVAATGAWAEMLATAAFVAGLDAGLALAELTGAAALVVTDAGDAVTSPGLERFLLA